jgi:hypothetical protein
MFKKKVSKFLIPMMMIALSLSNVSVFGADSGVKVQAFNAGTAVASNSINPKFKVANTSSTPINLSDLKLRYYYTADGNQTQSFWCDSSGMMVNNNYVNETNKVTGQFVKLSSATSTADTYLEVGFTSDAGQLAVGSTIEIQTRFAKSDWSNYSQANDYSFNSTASQYVDTDKITAYIAGKLVSGIEPSTQTSLNSTISPTSATFDKNSPADMAIKMTLNGNTLKEIDNGTVKLVSGTDYTLATDTVSLSKAYLASLADGSNTLTFKFSAGTDAPLSITVVPLSIKNSTINPTSVTFDKNNPADISINLTLNGNLLTEIDNGTAKLVSGTDYTLASNTVVLSKAYLAKLADGSNTLIFKFSAGANASLTVITTPIGIGITMTVGNVTGKAGDTIIVPINFSGVTTNNVLGTNFSVGYDSNLLEVVTVSSGDIVLNPLTNFAYGNLTSSNKVNLFFCDETYGSQIITKNGVFANITFKVKGTTAVVSPITISDGTVADINGNAISTIVKNGSVTIVP